MTPCQSSHFILVKSLGQKRVIIPTFQMTKLRTLEDVTLPRSCKCEWHGQDLLSWSLGSLSWERSLTCMSSAAGR